MYADSRLTLLSASIIFWYSAFVSFVPSSYPSSYPSWYLSSEGFSLSSSQKPSISPCRSGRWSPLMKRKTASDVLTFSVVNVPIIRIPASVRHLDRATYSWPSAKMLLISTFTRSYVCPCDLWIVIAHARRTGYCSKVPRSTVPNFVPPSFVLVIS